MNRPLVLVAVREFVTRGRSKLFLVLTVLSALGLSVAVVLPTLLAGGDDGGDPEPIRIGLIGELAPAQAQALEAVIGATSLEPVTDRAAAEEALRDDEFAAVIVAGEELLVPPEGFFSVGGPAGDIADVLGRAQALADAGVAAGEIPSVAAAPPLPIVEIGGEENQQREVRAVIANAAITVLYVTFLLYASWIIYGVVEEKSSRVVEILLGTIRPSQLMAGKVIGIGLLGLAQMVVIFGPGLAILAVRGGGFLPEGSGPLIAAAFGWWLLGFALYSVVAAGLGALVSRSEEVQAVLTPASFVIVAAFFLGFVALTSPDGTLAVVTALIPFTAPIVMLVRVALGSPALWEVVLSVVLTLATIALLTMVAGRIYRGAILRTGGRVKLREAWVAAGQ